MVEVAAVVIVDPTSNIIISSNFGGVVIVQTQKKRTVLATLLRICTPLIPSQVVSGILFTFPMLVTNSQRLCHIELTGVNSFNNCCSSS